MSSWSTLGPLNTMHHREVKSSANQHDLLAIVHGKYETDPEDSDMVDMEETDPDSLFQIE